MRLACFAASAKGTAAADTAGAGAEAGASAWLAMLAGMMSAAALLPPALALAALWATTGSRAGAAAPGKLGLMADMSLLAVACG